MTSAARNRYVGALRGRRVAPGAGTPPWRRRSRCSRVLRRRLAARADDLRAACDGLSESMQSRSVVDRLAVDDERVASCRAARRTLGERLPHRLRGVLAAEVGERLVAERPSRSAGRRSVLVRCLGRPALLRAAVRSGFISSCSSGTCSGKLARRNDSLAVFSSSRRTR